MRIMGQMANPFFLNGQIPEKMTSSNSLLRMKKHSIDDQLAHNTAYAKAKLLPYIPTLTLKPKRYGIRREIRNDKVKEIFSHR